MDLPQAQFQFFLGARDKIEHHRLIFFTFVMPVFHKHSTQVVLQFAVPTHQKKCRLHELETAIPLGHGMCQTDPLFSGATSFMCFNTHSFGPSNIPTDSWRGDSLAHVLLLSDHGTVTSPDFRFCPSNVFTGTRNNGKLPLPRTESGPLSRANFIRRKDGADFADVPVFRKKLIEQSRIEIS